MVLLPYEITLFSNSASAESLTKWVLLPYEITLFSNANADYKSIAEVLLPYEITLFSNYWRTDDIRSDSFTTL